MSAPGRSQALMPEAFRGEGGPVSGVGAREPPAAGLARGADTSLLSGTLNLAGRLDRRFFALLLALQQTGSLHKAARTAGYSYKGAWLLLETAANLARTPLVESARGGTGGGGTRLTPAACDLLAAWQQLQQRHFAFLREQEAWLLEQPALSTLLRRMSMKTTARNQFGGSITQVHRGPATAQVTIATGSGHEIVASMTAAAAERLQVRVGQDAIALIKASEVVLVTDFAGYKLSARNQMPGTIARIQKGAVSSMIGLTLPGGATLTATVTNDAVDALGLAVGQDATAVFKAYAVMVAVAQ